jgi:hypothetical protein
MSKRFSIMTAVAIAAMTVASSSAQVCMTRSKNITFVSAPGEVDAATSSVLTSCQQNPVTDNGECSTNLRCGFDDINPYPSGQVACFNSSHGIGYQMFGSPSQIDDLTRSILTQCQQTSVTQNSECSASVACADRSEATVPYPSGQVICSADSKGIHFEQRGADNAVQGLANATVTQCNQNPVTQNAECSQSLSCHDALADVPGDNHGSEIVCRTHSHNIPFQAHGPRDQVDNVTRDVLNQCTQNPVTVNAECTQNLHCD